MYFDATILKLNRSLYGIENDLYDTMTRIASGVKINNVSDDPGSYMLSKRLEAKIGSAQATNQAISETKTKVYEYDNELSSVEGYLDQIKELAETASTGTHTQSEFNSYDAQASAFMKSITEAINSANIGVDADTVGLSTANLINNINSLSVADAFDAGYDDDHIITDASEFVSKITADASGDFILANDIDMTELGTLSESAITSAFSGELDGNGYSIRNLTIEATGTTNVGLFQAISAGAELKNFSVKNFDISSENDASFIVASAASSTFNNISVHNSSLSGARYIGGIVANSSTNTIQYVSMSTDITTEGIAIGGIAGQTTHTSVSNSYMSGDLEATSSSGSISIGGVIGFGLNANISNVYTSGDIDAAKGNTGGIIGNSAFLAGNISNSYSTGNVSTSNGAAGGIIGSDGSGITISKCYSLGDISGTSDVGGIAGYFYGTMTDCYAAGKSSGGTDNGGVVGYIDAGMANSTNHWNSNAISDGVGYDDAAYFQGTAQTNISTGVTDASSAWSSSIWTKSGNLHTLDRTITDRTYSTKTLNLNIGADAGTSYAVSSLGIGFEGLSGIDLSNKENAALALSEINDAIAYFKGKKGSSETHYQVLKEQYEINETVAKKYSEGKDKILNIDEAKEKALLITQQSQYDSTLLLMSQISEMQYDATAMLLDF